MVDNVPVSISSCAARTSTLSCCKPCNRFTNRIPAQPYQQGTSAGVCSSLRTSKLTRLMDLQAVLKCGQDQRRSRAHRRRSPSYRKDTCSKVIPVRSVQASLLPGTLQEHGSQDASTRATSDAKFPTTTAPCRSQYALISLRNGIVRFALKDMTAPSCHVARVWSAYIV